MEVTPQYYEDDTMTLRLVDLDHENGGASASTLQISTVVLKHVHKSLDNSDTSGANA